MDLSKLASSLLNSDSIEGLSKLTGASGSDVTKVLSKALPSLLDGAKTQAQDSSTAKSFATALSDHRKDDTSDLSKFLGKIDLEDGAKIITHLLGSGKDDIFKKISKETGISKSTISSILSAVAPLLMSLLGQQTKKDADDDDSVIGDLVGSLLDNVDVGDLLTGLLTDNSSKKSSKSKSGSGTKKKKTSSKKDSSDLIGGLLKNILK